MGINQNKETVELDKKNFKLTMTGNFIAGDPGVHTFRNGDPGYPPTPAEFEFDTVECDNVAELLNDIDEFYYQKIKKLKEDIKKNIEYKLKDLIFKEQINEVLHLIDVTYSHENYSESIMNEAADKLEREQ